MARIVTDKNFNEVLSEGKPVVLDFWAEWCGPCRMVSPVIDELAVQYEGQVIIGKVNVDDNNDIVAQFGIRNIPTVLFFKDKQIIDKQVGVTGKATFVEKIEKLLA
ncbi:MAG: thioredoxin [Tannerella sp.]|jgi:thioredoxin 1|nr:thioredoxin [Tannerella sp.]